MTHVLCDIFTFIVCFSVMTLRKSAVFYREESKQEFVARRKFSYI